MKFKYLMLLVACASISSHAYAMDLRAALAAAYNNSEELKMAQETFMGEIEQMPQAISGFLPTISATVSKDDQKGSSISRYQSGSQETSSISRNLSLRQNLFSGGSDVAAIKAAQSAYRSSRAKLYGAEQKVLLDALDSYMSFYEAKETYDIREATVEFYAKQLASVDERFKLGEATRTDVAQANAGLAKAESDKSMAFANLESAKAIFMKTFATDPLDVALPDAPSDLPGSLEDLTSKASVANFTVQQVKHAVASSKASAVGAKGALLPSADFNAQLGTKYFDPEHEPNRADQYQNNTNGRTFTTSISLTIPILNRGGAEYSRIRKANSEARRSMHQLEEVMHGVKADTIRAWSGYNAAKAAIISADQAVEAYELVLEGTNYEYNVGSKAILDVLKAEEDFHNIKVQRIKVQKDRITSAYQMKASMGEMTAVALKLPVKYFNPGTEFRKVKAKIIGF